MSERKGVSAATMRRAGKMADMATAPLRVVLKPTTKLGFPYRPPTKPKGVVVPVTESKLGADYDTEWARRAPANAARAVINRGPLQLFVKVLADPEILGVDRLADLQAKGDDAPALIFAPNHHSHIDTPLIVTAVLNALPIDREVTGRKSSDLIRDLIDDGWSLVIYPEGGRSPDGWGQEFKGGAAYISIRTGAPVVPVFIDGTGAIFGKGMKRPKPGKSRVVFGAPLRPVEGESTRRFNARIEAAVTALGDEALTDFWTARQRAAAKTSPKLTGPEYNGWRRQWQLSEQRKLGAAGVRRRQKRRWPDLD